MMPGQVLEGRTSFAWHQGGAFVIMHSEMQQREVPQGVAIFGSDDDGRMVLIYFDQRGVSRHYQVSLNGSEMRWRRDDTKISHECASPSAPMAGSSSKWARCPKVAVHGKMT